MSQLLECAFCCSPSTIDYCDEHVFRGATMGETNEQRCMVQEGPLFAVISAPESVLA